MLNLKERIKEVKNSKSGSIYITACCIMVVVLMIASVVWTYTSAITLTRETADSATACLRIVQTDHSIEQNTKRFIQRKKIPEATVGTLESKFMDSFVTLLHLQTSDGYNYYSVDDDGIENYHIEHPVLTMSIASDTKIIVNIQYYMCIPLRFMGDTVAHTKTNINRSVSIDMQQDSDDIIRNKGDA